MARIKSVVGAVNHGAYATVSVVLEDGTECEVYVGGDVEVFYDATHHRVKAVVKRRKFLKPLDKKQGADV